jgi:hypothetical protein
MAIAHRSLSEYLFFNKVEDELYIEHVCMVCIYAAVVRRKHYLYVKTFVKTKAAASTVVLPSTRARVLNYSLQGFQEFFLSSQQHHISI